MVLLYLFIVERNGFVKKSILVLVHWTWITDWRNNWIFVTKNLAKQKNMDTL